MLRGMGVEEVVVTGVMTNLCCETTAREAFVRGFRVFFSADATATANRELHEATLKNMAYGFAYLVDCDRLKAAFTRKSWALLWSGQEFESEYFRITMPQLLFYSVNLLNNMVSDVYVMPSNSYIRHLMV